MAIIFSTFCESFLLIILLEVSALLFLDKEKIEGKILSQPKSEDLGDLAPFGLIVEFYSR